MIQVQLPDEVSQFLKDIRSDRAAKCEPITNKAIIIDALKEMHSRLKESQYGTQA